MKKLSKREMKVITGGAQKFIWNCLNGSVCSDVDPSTICGSGGIGGCSETDCSMTGTKCSTLTVCVC